MFFNKHDLVHLVGEAKASAYIKKLWTRVPSKMKTIHVNVNYRGKQTEKVGSVGHYDLNKSIEEVTLMTKHKSPRVNKKMWIEILEVLERLK